MCPNVKGTSISFFEIYVYFRPKILVTNLVGKVCLLGGTSSHKVDSFSH